MKTFAILAAVGASAFLVTAASAAPLSANISVLPDANIHNVRMVCNETAVAGTNVASAASSSVSRGVLRIRSQAYMERRDHDEDRRGGIGIRVPGVSVGIGGGRF